MLKKKVILFFLILFVFHSVFAVEEENSSAIKSLLTLSPDMISTMHEQQTLYKNAFMKKHNIIVAVFSPAGGEFFLYRKGKPFLKAEPVPQYQSYEFATIVEHTAMEPYLLSILGIYKPENRSVYMSQMRDLEKKIMQARSNIDNLPVTLSEKKLFHSILNLSAQYINVTTDRNIFSKAATDQYAQSLKPYLVELTQIIANYQVSHWMNVVHDWKFMLGNDWQNTYAVVMYINTKPKNNIFLDILIHFMGQKAVGKKLYYFTTTSYTPTSDEALDSLIRELPDQELASEIYGDYFLNYSQILGVAARQAILKWN